MKNEVYLIDCMEFMKGVPDKYYELAIIDPPYGLKISNSEYLGNTKNDKRWAGRENGYRHTKKDWDDKTPDVEYWDELRRVSKNQIVWGWNYFVEYFNECPSYIVWNKETSGNYSDCEMAYCSIKGTNKIFTWLWNGFRKKRPEERIHPTQKPIALYLWLLNNYAKQGDKIFDSHVGSGSSRIACDKLGYYFEGCELDKDYWEAQEKRYKDYKSQLTLQL